MLELLDKYFKITDKYTLKFYWEKINRSGGFQRTFEN